MDGEFKTILYIMIGIGYFIVRLYQKEVSKQKGNTTPRRTTQRKTAAEIFRELQKTLNLPDTRVESKKVNTTLPVEGGKRQKLQKKQSLIHKAYKKEIKSTVKKPVLVAEKPVEQAQEITQPHFEFDVRKAIVYSEILKRPNY